MSFSFTASNAQIIDTLWHQFSFGPISRTITSPACVPAVSLNSCNFIRNEHFVPNYSNNPPDPSEVQDAIGLQLVQPWLPSHGSPQVYDPQVFNFIAPPSLSSGYSRMGTLYDGLFLGEGIVERIPNVQQGRKYLMSFLKRKWVRPGHPNTDVQNFKIVLMYCKDYNSLNPNSYDPPPLPRKSQTIYCETNVSNSNWEQIVVSFNPDANFDMIWIFPSQSVPGPEENLLFSNPELIDVTDVEKRYDVNYGGSCQYTITPNFCAAANALFTWRDPFGSIVQQGPNQNLNIHVGNPGKYTLTTEYPSAVVTNNTCSNNNSTLVTEYEVAYNCDCDIIGNEIINPTFTYLQENTNGSYQSDYTVSLSNCSVSSLCFVVQNEQHMFFNATVNNPTNNLWEVRVLEDPLNPINPPFNNFISIINGQPINLYPFSNFQPYSYTQNGYADLWTLNAVGVYNLEFRHTNLTTGIQRSIIVKLVPRANLGECWNVSTSPLNQFPHHIFLGSELPGYNYTWTFPSGITVLPTSPLALKEWDDVLYDYVNNPSPVVTLQLTNTFGCPSYSIQQDIHYLNCSQGSRFIKREETKGRNSLTITSEIPAVSILPNPTSGLFRVNSGKRIINISILNETGLRISNFSFQRLTSQVNVSRLPMGSYVVRIIFENGVIETKKLIKL